MEKKNPWCHGWPCGDRPKGVALECPGCHAQKNPCATGPHTKIVEEWEHEYGAPMRVVVSPTWMKNRGWERWSMGPNVLRLWFETPLTFAAVGARVVNGPGHLGARSVEQAREILHGPEAEKLALEWSPEV